MERKRKVALNRSVATADGLGLPARRKHKSFLVGGGFAPQFGAPAKGGLTPDRIVNKSDENSSNGPIGVQK